MNEITLKNEELKDDLEKAKSMSRDFERRLNEALNKNKLLVSYQARLKDAAESTNQIWLEIKEEEKEPQ